MDLKKFLFYIMLCGFMIFSINVTGTTALSYANYTTDTTNQCTTPTLTFFISAESIGTAFNITTFNAPKNTCIAISFTDLGSIPHSFTINADSGNNIAQFNIYQDGTNTNAKTLNFMTPNSNITIVYFCAVPGHFDSGMIGHLVIGSGTPLVSSSTPSVSSSTPLVSTVTTSSSIEIITTTPNFEVFSILILLIVIYAKRKNKND